VTLLEQPTRGEQPEQPEQPQLKPPMFAEDARQLAEQWRVLTRLATGVAILTAPFFFLLLYQVGGWTLAAAIFVTVLAVIMFRGLVEVLTRKLIPYPSLFGDEGRLREEDLISRRRAWFWRRVFKFIITIAVLYSALALFIWVVKAFGGGISIGDAFAAPVTWMHDQANDPNSRYQFIYLAISLPILFFVNFFIFMGPLLYAGIRQISAFEPGDADWGVRLDDVRGQAEPKEEIRRIVNLWQSGDDFERAGGKRERGVLFLGPPGTGKTMLAKAIATGFNCPFVSIPGSAFAQTFIGIDVVLVMYMAWRARRLATKWGGQCIVFIDEIDAVGMRRQALQGGLGMSPAVVPTIHDYCFYGPYGAINSTGDLILEDEAWRNRLFAARAPERPAVYPAPVQRFSDKVRNYAMPGMMGGGGQGGLQQLLVVMDGVTTPKASRRFFTNRLNTWMDASYIVPQRIGAMRLRLPPAPARTEQIYFIGACNVPLEVLDPALTRPGRMGRHVRFRTPNKDDRQDIFDLYLGKVAHDPELDRPERREELARITMGHSPAMIEQVCSMALTVAHHEGRERFDWQDLVDAITTVEAGIDTGFKYIPEEGRAIAIHEAGHAVTGHVFQKGRISTRLTIRPRGSSGGHHAMGEKDERFAHWRHEMFANLIWSLGAMAAEKVFYGENSTGVGGDLSSATAVAGLMVGSWGMAPEVPDLGDRFQTEAEREKAQRRLMRKFETMGIQLMARASVGAESTGDPLGAVLGDPTKRGMIAQLLGQAFCAAYWLIEGNREAVERVADVLIEKRELFGDEVVNLLDSLNLRIPEVDPLDEARWPKV
jgi:cell division protease FtsH